MRISFYKNVLLILIGVLTMTTTTLSHAANHADGSSSTARTEWKEYIDRFATMGDDLLPLLHDENDSLERQQMYEYIFSQIASGYVTQFYSDPAHPDWWPLFSHVLEAMWANPDTVYYYTPVESTGTYRIAGNRGEVRLADLQLAGGRFVTEGTTEGSMGKVHDNVSLNELAIKENADFELIVSPTRPDGYTGHWARLTPEITYFLLRQVDYDFNKRPVTVSIERVDTPARGSRPSAADLSRKLNQMSVWTRNWIRVAYACAKMDRQRSERAGGFVDVGWMESGFLGQKYHVFAFDLADDEVVVIENEVPAVCAYWAYQVVTDSWRSVNPLRHQSSLNPLQSHLDSDGRFRAVISSSDPGVKNWLDNGGHNRAVVYSRFNGCDHVSMPTAKVVKKAELGNHLPPDTLYVTPQEREASLRERARMAQLRRRW